MDERVNALIETVRQLSEQLERTRADLAMLQRQGADDSSSWPADDDAPPAECAVPRRRLMRWLGTGAAVGVAALGSTALTATPAAAAPTDDLVIGAANDGGSTSTSLTGNPGPGVPTFAVTNTYTPGGLGLYAVSDAPTGNLPASAAVLGDSQNNYGVVGFSANSPGVFGRSEENFGVQGFSPSGIEISGEANQGIGVHGFSDQAAGVYGESNTNPGTNIAGVVGFAANNPGVLGLARKTGSLASLRAPR